MGTSDIRGVRGEFLTDRQSGKRPGDALREAQRMLEARLGELIATFGRSYGVTVASVYVEYVDAPGSAPASDARPIVRVALET